MKLTADVPDDRLARAVRDFLEQRAKIQAGTIEGLQAIRRGELIDHSEMRGDFDNWGGRQSSGPA